MGRTSRRLFERDGEWRWGRDRRSVTRRFGFFFRLERGRSCRRVAAEGRHPLERRTRARARDDEPPRKDAALLHLPPTSKPNMSNSPCVATSTRLLRSFAGGRALRSARCGAASAAALEGVGRASALGMASARTIAASIPMRRSRRNIEEGGSPVVQSVVVGRCFATVQCDQARGRRFESFQARTRDSRRSRAHARSRASTGYVCRRELLTTEPRFEARAAAREVPKRAPRTTLVTKPDERNARNSRADRRGRGP